MQVGNKRAVEDSAVKRADEIVSEEGVRCDVECLGDSFTVMGQHMDCSGVLERVVGERESRACPRLPLGTDFLQLILPCPALYH